MKVRKVPEGLHAVLAVDPGNTTGVAAAYFDFKWTLIETLQGKQAAKSVEVDGDWLKQGYLIAEMMWRFLYRANVENGIPIPRIHFVFEDFVLRRRESGGATGNLTSCWVAASAVTAFKLVCVREARGPLLKSILAEDIKWTQASQAKGFATNDRLKIWKMYEVGSEHKRDAWRHVALRVNEILL